jgi:hypothetical protein
VLRTRAIITQTCCPCRTPVVGWQPRQPRTSERLGAPVDRQPVGSLTGRLALIAGNGQMSRGCGRRVVERVCHNPVQLWPISNFRSLQQAVATTNAPLLPYLPRLLVAGPWLDQELGRVGLLRPTRRQWSRSRPRIQRMTDPRCRNLGALVTALHPTRLAGFL